MAPPLYFPASANARIQLTEALQFTYAATVGLWNLRWQVRGFNEALDANNKELVTRFAAGTGVDGADLLGACVQASWESQVAGFLRMVLTTQIAIYEEWIDEVLGALGKNSNSKRKGLQFPAALASGHSAGDVLSALHANESPITKDAFYSSLKKNRKYQLAHLEALLLCFRYFKEARNCAMHRGGIVDAKAENAFAEFSTVATTSALGLKEVPEHEPLVEGKLVRLKWRGVVGFSEVILRLIATLDAELCYAEGAEDYFISRWKKEKVKQIQLRHGEKPEPGVKSALVKLKLPKTASLGKLIPFLREHRLVVF
ncbi:MAG: hypothetical protein AB7N76_12725 [Planctomycetota bacterium]